jgi:hypothetical protein
VGQLLYERGLASAAGSASFASFSLEGIAEARRAETLPYVAHECNNCGSEGCGITGYILENIDKLL